jgi:hypothetical protein
MPQQGRFTRVHAWALSCPDSLDARALLLAATKPSEGPTALCTHVTLIHPHPPPFFNGVLIFLWVCFVLLFLFFRNSEAPNRIFLEPISSLFRFVFLRKKTKRPSSLLMMTLLPAPIELIDATQRMMMMMMMTTNP